MQENNKMESIRAQYFKKKTTPKHTLVSNQPSLGKSQNWKLKCYLLLKTTEQNKQKQTSL